MAHINLDYYGLSLDVWQQLLLPHVLCMGAILPLSVAAQ